MDDRRRGGDLDLERTRAKLVEYFESFVGNRADAEDLAQQRLERWLRIHRLTPVANSEAHIWSGVRNLAIDFLRKLKRERIWIEPLDADEMDGLFEFVTAYINQETAVEKLDLIRSQMKEKWWRAICLYYYEGLTAQETGKQLGVSEAGARKYLREAHKIIDQIARRRRR